MRPDRSPENWRIERGTKVRSDLESSSYRIQGRFVASPRIKTEHTVRNVLSLKTASFVHRILRELTCKKKKKKHTHTLISINIIRVHSGI